MTAEMLAWQIRFGAASNDPQKAVQYINDFVIQEKNNSEFKKAVEQFKIASSEFSKMVSDFHETVSDFNK